MTVLKDGSGSGYTAKVNKDNKLEVDSISRDFDEHINQDHQKVWSLSFEAIDPVGADDYFFYIKNTGTTDLKITDIRAESTVAGTIEWRSVTGTPTFTAGVDVTPVNRFVGSSNTPSATIKTDTDTTGLTSVGTIFFQRIDTINKLHHLGTSSNVILPPGQEFALLWDAATGILKGTVSLVEVV